jgi:hypothetical protein
MEKNGESSGLGVLPDGESRGFLTQDARRFNRKMLQQQEDERKRFQDILHKQEQEFEMYREGFRREQLERETKIQNQNEARDRNYAEREKKLLSRQREFESLLMERQGEVDTLHKHLRDLSGQRETELEQAKLELKQQKERYNEDNRKRLESTSRNYVVEALEALKDKEQQFHKISKIWSVVGAGALVAGLGFFAYVTISSLATLQAQITWEVIVFTMLKGLIAVGLLGALSRYAFLFSNSYIRESLKNADRRHAINFGKFYLESYGAAADWAQIKEAFEHWNITGSNAFSRSEDVRLDVASIDKAASLLERVSKVLQKPKGDDAS